MKLLWKWHTGNGGADQPRRVWREDWRNGQYHLIAPVLFARLEWVCELFGIELVEVK